MRTPPGPKIFSAGPRSKCISVKSNFSLPLAWYISSFFLRKKSCISLRSLHFIYSCAVIITGALMYVSDILEPMIYRSIESLYSTCCLRLSGRLRSAAPCDRSSRVMGSVRCICQRGCNSESGMESSSASNGCAVIASVSFWFLASACFWVASAALRCSAAARLRCCDKRRGVCVMAYAAMVDITRTTTNVRTEKTRICKLSNDFIILLSKFINPFY